MFLHPASVDLVVVVGLRAVALHVAPSTSCGETEIRLEIIHQSADDRIQIIHPFFFFLPGAWCKILGN